MPTYSISLLGTEGTGKSCFLAGLNLLGFNPLDASITLSPNMDDADTKRYLHHITAALQNGQFPPATNITTFLDFEIRLAKKQSVMRIQTVDYPGEDFRHGFNDETPENKIKDFAGHLLKSDIVILLIDPNDIISDDSVRRQRIKEKLHANIEAALAVAKQYDISDNKAKIKKPDVCIVVAKCDTLANFEEIKKASDRGRVLAKEFVQKHWADFEYSLKTTSDVKKIEYFPVSAVGTTTSDRKPDKDNLAPFGYQTLFRWIEERKNRQDWIRFTCRALKAGGVVGVVVGGVVGIALLLCGGKFAIDTIKEQEQLTQLGNSEISVAVQVQETERPVSDKVKQKRDELLDEELARLEEEIDKTQDIHRLEEYRQELANFTFVPADRKAKWDNLKNNISNKTVEIEYQRVKTGYETKGSTFITLAEEFLKNHTLQPQAEDVKKMLGEHQKGVMQDERQRIKGLVVRDSGSLQRKSEEIIEFVKKYRSRLSATETEMMERAADLAKRFSESNSYTVTLKQYGGFAYQEDIMGIVYVGGDRIGSHSSKGKCTTATPNEPFSIRWSCGTEIRLQIQAYAGVIRGGIEPVAETTFKGTDALRKLAGRTVLSPKTGGGWDWSLPSRMAQGGYFMSFSIEGISDADWSAFENYILPGNAW